MTFATQLATDVAAFFDTTEFATTVTYAGESISAIVSYNDNLDEQSGSAVATAILWVKVTDVAAPAYRDAVVIEAVTWYMRKILFGDGHIWQLELERDERPIL